MQTNKLKNLDLNHVNIINIMHIKQLTITIQHRSPIVPVEASLQDELH